MSSATQTVYHRGFGGRKDNLQTTSGCPHDGHHVGSAWCEAWCHAWGHWSMQGIRGAVGRVMAYPRSLGRTAVQIPECMPPAGWYFRFCPADLCANRPAPNQPPVEPSQGQKSENSSGHHPPDHATHVGPGISHSVMICKPLTRIPLSALARKLVSQIDCRQQNWCHEIVLRLLDETLDE